MANDASPGCLNTRGSQDILKEPCSLPMIAAANWFGTD